MQLAYCFSFLVLAVSLPDAHLRATHHRRPLHTHYAEFARWLVSEGEWGIIATSGETRSKDRNFAAPFSNVVSFTESNGVPVFYLTKLDPTGLDLEISNYAAFTIAEKSLSGRCKLSVAEEPICAKLTISGTISPMDKNDEKYSEYEKLLVNKFPQMRLWPSDHGFQVYTMEVMDLFLIDFYGGAPQISVEDYFKANLERYNGEFSAFLTSGN
eukprot:maker-scaffold_9-snap-gene-4.12-mRNA-1 protein AED:0.04 eAED:0.04 QI:386/1/1/1/0/0.2/5/106/212